MTLPVIESLLDGQMPSRGHVTCHPSLTISDDSVMPPQVVPPQVAPPQVAM